MAAITASACTIFELNDSGFAANAVHLLHMEPIFGGGNNGTLFVDASKFAYRCSEGGGWHDFFRVEDVLVPWSQGREAVEGVACQRMGFQDIDELLHRHFSFSWNDVDAMGAHKLWRPQEWVRARMDYKLRALATYPQPTMGFHIRGGDKGEEDVLKKRKTTEPADFIRAALRAWPGLKVGTCVLVGDDFDRMRETEQLARKHLGCQIFRSVPYFRREGHVQYHFNVQGFEERCAGTADFLVDIELLARTDYATLTFNSGLAHLVDVLRVAVYGKHRSTFVDASNARQDWWQPIRRHFRTARRKKVAQRVMQRRQPHESG
ncbi:hypothetical protein WJX75_007057 [Coccomyxa subellipsoidea]|uniref:O-fucosyltransferase family protein n=1 Tax=Coccomyxa subellipsoidea TaxID=248742 RepID=A0ABR2YB62_9CHLO